MPVRLERLVAAHTFPRAHRQRKSIGCRFHMGCFGRASRYRVQESYGGVKGKRELEVKRLFTLILCCGVQAHRGL